MNLILLCAGFATRLEPTTFKTPKHLLEARGKKLINHFYDLVKDSGEFDRQLFLTNERYFHQFNQWIKENNYPIEIFNDGVGEKKDKLGAIGDLLFLIKEAKIKGDIFLTSPDYIYYGYDFGAMFKKFKEVDASLDIVSVEDDMEEVKACSCVEVDKEGRIVRFEEKPAVPFSNQIGGPYYIIKDSDTKYLEQIPEERRDNIGAIGEILSKKSELYAHKYEGEILHISTKEDLDLARN